MPELPEIETLARQLRDAVVRKTIVRVECAQPKMLNMPLPQFAKLAAGKITGVGRRAKSAILYEDDGSIWLHLGLRAEVRLVTETAEELKPVLSLIFADGMSLRLAKVFMGRASFVNPDEFQSRWDEFGPEPLSENFTALDLTKILYSKPMAPVKSVLMEQELIAGIGNLYSDEILRWAHINPLRKASTLASDEVGRLYDAVKAVLEAAIAAGGEMDYTDLYGREGGFEPTVHRREVCRACGSSVKKIKVQGRTGYFCSYCNP